jgi:cytoskeleton protein RodZ
MSESLEHLPSAATVAEAGAPNSLRALRESAGLHVAALAAMLKVPVRRLEALEAGRYEDLPDMTFARALASSVCRVLKVDSAPVLAALPGSQTVRLGVNENGLNTPFRTSMTGGRGTAPASKHQPLTLKPAWAALALVVVALVLWWTLPNAEAPGTATTVVRTPLPEGDATPLAAPVAPVAAEPTPAPNSATVAASTPVVAEPSVPQTAPNNAAILRLMARDTVWVEVVGAQNKLLLQRNLQAGETAEFSTDAPYRVTSGRADVLDVAVRGQALDVLAKARNNVARFEVQ